MKSDPLLKKESAEYSKYIFIYNQNCEKAVKRVIYMIMAGRLK